MTPENKKGVIVVASIAAIGFVGYYFFIYKKSKKYYVNNIFKKGIIDKSNEAKTKSVLMGYGDDYIKAWSDALNSGAETFKCGERKCYSQGGSAVR